MKEFGMSSYSQKRLHYFDSSTIHKGSTILIIGKRFSGKSVLQYDLLSQMRDWYSFGIALTPTKTSAIEFARCIPKAFIHEQSCERVTKFMKMAKQLHDSAVDNNEPPRHSFLFCDDTAFDKKFMRGDPITHAFMNGRHDDVTVSITLQYCKTVTPAVRNNADYVFIMYTTDLVDRKMIRETWFSMFKSSEFDEILDEATRKFGVLVLDTRAAATSRDWRNCVFWYRATLGADIGHFRLCDDIFYKMEELARKQKRRNGGVVGPAAADVARVKRLAMDGTLFRDDDE
jgi:hypothetical protein